MGLDVYVWKNAKLERELPNGYDSISYEDADAAYDSGCRVVAGNNFVAQRDGRPDGIYSGEKGHSFRAGSYLGYNMFRSALCEIAIGVSPEEVWENPEKYKDHPIYSLINFSDAEGFIGPDTALTLHGGFEAFRGDVEKEWSSDHAFSDGVYFLETYNNFALAFEESAGNGFVSFC